MMIAVSVGTIKESRVHLMLLVSANIVFNVVAHGKCKSENNITFTAVKMFQPLSLRS